MSNSKSSRQSTLSSIPNKKWTLAQLGAFASKAIVESENCESQLLALSRRSTVAVFRAGKALCLARTQIKKGWVAWLDEMKIPRTTDFECRKLFSAAKTEKALGNLSIHQAKIKFGIVKEKTPSHLRSECSQSPESEPGVNQKPAKDSKQMETSAPKAPTTSKSSRKPSSPKSSEQEPPEPQEPEITDEEDAAFHTFCNAIGGLARSKHVFDTLWEAAQ